MQKEQKYWYPYEPFKFEADTRDLPADHLGAYQRLINQLYMRQKPIPMDKKILGDLTKLSPYKLVGFMEIIPNYFTIINGEITHDKVTSILRDQKKRARQRALKARNAAHYSKIQRERTAST